MDQAYEAIVKSKRSALVYAATSLMSTQRIAACVVEVPETNPQQYVAAGTPEQIAGLLPEAGIKPARRKDDMRPTEPLSFEDEADSRATAPHAGSAVTRYAPNDNSRHYADFPEGPMRTSPSGDYVLYRDHCRILAAHSSVTVGGAAPTDAATYAGESSDFLRGRDEGVRQGRAVIDIHNEQMDSNRHYRERVFNQILELDAKEGLNRFARVTEASQRAAAPTDADAMWEKAIAAEAEANQLRRENENLRAALLAITKNPGRCVSIADAALLNHPQE